MGISVEVLAGLVRVFPEIREERQGYFAAVPPPAVAQQWVKRR
jgi:hypothetical protein